MFEEGEDGCPVLGVFANHVVLYLNITPFFVMSAHGPHMYHNEKRFMHTVEQV